MLLTGFGGTGAIVLFSIILSQRLKQGPFTVMDFRPPFLPEEKSLLAWLAVMGTLALIGLALWIWNRKAPL